MNEDLRSWSGAAEAFILDLEALMSHANAALTPRHRLRIARLIIDDGWPIVLAAHQFNVSLADREAVGHAV